MSVTIPIDPKSESRLRERAEAAGDDLAGFVSKLVVHFGALPTPPDVLSGSLADRFRASGDTEEELIEEIERAKDAMRAERHARDAK